MTPPGRRRRRDAPAPVVGALRIIAGELRGRRIDAPGGSESRPTGDRVRESILNALDSRGAIDGAVVLDAFAGSGALGIEALSRGADHVLFADASAAATAVVRGNLATLDLAGRAEVRTSAALSAVGTGDWDVVFLDPPYGHADEEWAVLLDAVRRRLRPDGIVVVESDRDLEVPEGLDALRTRRYGGTVVTFLIHTGVDE